jgi:hypothetical protein
MSDDPNRKIQIAHHPADDGKLLPILLSKNGYIRSKNQE